MKTITLTLLLTFISFILHAGGFIILYPTGNPHTRPIPITSYSLEMKSLNVDVNIDEQIATTSIEQVFYNPNNSNLEGYFLFPVPKGVVLRNFTMDVNGKKLQAELLDAKKARKYYQDIVRNLLDPALLEYTAQDLFKVKIFPIEAKKDKKISISYTQNLTKDNNTFEYIFPLNTKKYSAKPLKNIAFKIEIQNKIPIKTLYSPTHKVEKVFKDAKHAIVGFEEKQVKPDLDFKLYIGLNATKLGVSMLNYNESNNDGFFIMNISPGFDNQSEIAAKDITFVLDVSGSMSGEKMGQAKKSMLFCVNQLNHDDRFEIIKFSTVAESLFGKRLIANKTNKTKAIDFINKLKAIGGTNMDEAFELALKEKPQSERPHFIIFITDGKPTIGEIDEEKLVEKISKGNTDKIRIFTFGIGNEINTHLLDKITEHSGAYRSYISPEEDIEVKISGFYEKVSSPVLTGVEIDFDKKSGVYSVFPRKTGDVFKGSIVTVFGRYKNNGKSTIKLNGILNGKKETYTYKIDFEENTKNDFIPPLWASRNIGYLLDQIRLNGEKQELIDEVIRLSKLYGIITPYTSYLILEDERIGLNKRILPPENVIFNNRAIDDDAFRSAYTKEYSNIQKKSGEESVQSSVEIQELSEAGVVNDINQGSARMFYTDKNGKRQNFARQVKNIQGRAIYQNGDQWIDLYVQETNTIKTNKIQFADEAYFKLLNKHPKTAQFLSLGRNVRFVFQGELYEIFY